MPSKILVCMFYYPDQSSVDGWAGPVLRAIGYHQNPARVERLIRKAFQEAIATIQIPGCPQVIPVPLYQVLDGKSPADYVASVEPSAVGGNKLAASRGNLRGPKDCPVELRCIERIVLLLLVPIPLAAHETKHKAHHSAGQAQFFIPKPQTRTADSEFY